MKAALVLAVSILVYGCGGPPAATQSPGRAATLAPTPRPPDLPVATPPPVSEVPEAFLDAILEEVASLSSVAVGQILVIREAVTWPNGSLGCPEPDMIYTQALVDGYWVVVQAGGEEYDFRVDGTGAFRLCAQQPGRPSMTIEIPPPIY